jgi:hypothetical protein
MMDREMVGRQLDDLLLGDSMERAIANVRRSLAARRLYPRISLRSAVRWRSSFSICHRTISVMHRNNIQYMP